MMVKSTEGAHVALDLGKLLGFKHVAVSAGKQASLARALGAACNKVGGEIGKNIGDTTGIPLGVINTKPPLR